MAVETFLGFICQFEPVFTLLNASEQRSDTRQAGLQPRAGPMPSLEVVVRQAGDAGGLTPCLTGCGHLMDRQMSRQLC